MVYLITPGGASPTCKQVCLFRYVLWPILIGTSNQIGNLIFIALGVAGKPEQPDMLWAKSLIALMSFLMGNLVFVYGSRFLGPTRRLTLILSFALKTLMLFGAALLVQLVPPMPDDPTSVEWRKAVAISLLSFQAAGQIAASRLLGFSEIPTVVLTALVCDLFLDVKLYQRPWRANAKRNRRIGAALGHFFGAMTAGGFAKEVGLAGGLWFSMSLKGSITVAWFVWSGKRQAKSVS